MLIPSKAARYRVPAGRGVATRPTFAGSPEEKRPKARVIASISDSMDRELISRSLSATEYLFANTLERTANQAARGHPAATAMVSHPFPEGRKENTMELLKATANSRIRETRLLAKRTFPSCMAIWVFPLRRNDEQML